MFKGPDGTQVTVDVEERPTIGDAVEEIRWDLGLADAVEVKVFQAATGSDEGENNAIDSDAEIDPEVIYFFVPGEDPEVQRDVFLLQSLAIESERFQHPEVSRTPVPCNDLR